MGYIFSDRASRRVGNIFSAGRRSNPKSLVAGEALGKAVWVIGQSVKKTAGSHPEFISGSHEMKFQS
jgi:hypothetical protein